MYKFFYSISAYLLMSFALAADFQEKLVNPFPQDGMPAGWSVREWNDLAKEVNDSPWKVTEGILKSGPKTRHMAGQRR